MGERIEIKDDFIYLNTNLINFFITSGDWEFISNFYDKVLEFKKGEGIYRYREELELEVRETELLSFRKIKSSEVLFKTLGMCISTDPRQYAKDFERWYVTPSDGLERFNEVLRIRTKDKIKYLTEKVLFLNSLEFKPLSEKSITREIVKHYGGYVKGFKGYFT